MTATPGSIWPRATPSGWSRESGRSSAQGSPSPFRKGYAGFVQPRSGLAARHGIAVVNSPGLIDSGYRGEIKVVLLNTDRERTFVAEPGERIAQLVVLPVPEVAIREVDELPESVRGVRGFGSSQRM
jgi:dUTP pyrophosphatase